MITDYAVLGMTCDHCEHRVGTEIGLIDGVTAVSADASTGIVRVTSDAPISDEAVAAAVDEAGYELAGR